MRSGSTRPDEQAAPIRRREIQDALDIARDLRDFYAVRVRSGPDGGGALPLPSLLRPWDLGELRTVQGAVRDLAAALGGAAAFQSRLGATQIVRGLALWYRGLTWAAGVIALGVDPDAWTVVHELGHSWDLRGGGAPSRRLQLAVGAHDCPLGAFRRFLRPEDRSLWYDPGSSPPPCGVDGNFNCQEDYAESVAAYVYPEVARERARRTPWPYDDYRATPRGRFIAALISESG